MKRSLLQSALEVVTCYAAARQALASNGRGQLDDESLEACLQAIEQRTATLLGVHWALDALVSWLGRPAWLPRPVCALLMLACASCLFQLLGP